MRDSKVSRRRLLTLGGANPGKFMPIAVCRLNNQAGCGSV